MFKTGDTVELTAAYWRVYGLPSTVRRLLGGPLTVLSSVGNTTRFTKTDDVTGEVLVRSVPTYYLQLVKQRKDEDDD